MPTPQLIQLQKQVQVMEERCLFHEQQFSGIRTSFDKLDARLDKIETDLSLVTFPVKLVKIALKAFFKIEV